MRESSRSKPVAAGCVVFALAVLGSGRIANAQKFTAWSAPVNLGPVVNSTFFDQ
jgi:hypothetical protein